MVVGKAADPGAKLPQGSEGKTRDALADMAGVSGRTLDKVERIEAEAIPGPALHCPTPTLSDYKKRNPMLGGEAVGGFWQGVNLSTWRGELIPTISVLPLHPVIPAPPEGA